MPLQTVTISGRSIEFELPDPDAMLNEAVAGEAAGTPGWDPYWGLLWAAATPTAKLMQFRPSSATTALELGCGVGLTGIAALQAGLDVTFSDQSPAAVQMACRNAERNGFPSAKGLAFDWQSPPSSQFDLLFGSDILYDPRGHSPLLITLSRLLNPGGQVWIGDAGRAHAPAFVSLAQAAGWQVTNRDHHFRPIHQPAHLQYRLLILTKGGS